MKVLIPDELVTFSEKDFKTEINGRIILPSEIFLDESEDAIYEVAITADDELKKKIEEKLKECWSPKGFSDIPGEIEEFGHHLYAYIKIQGCEGEIQGFEGVFTDEGAYYRYGNLDAKLWFLDGGSNLCGIDYSLTEDEEEAIKEIALKMQEKYNEYEKENENENFFER